MTDHAAPARTFTDVLAATLRRDPSRPLVTFYDDETGERVELSVTTYANWVAKTAGLVEDELGLDPGDLVLVDLPTHWLGPVWLGALWSGGQVVTTDPGAAAEASLVVCGPDRVETLGGTPTPTPVVALSLRPFGAPFAGPLPEGVVDYGAVVLSQPDVFVAPSPPAGTDRAWQDAAGSTTHAQLLAEADRADLLGPSGRLVTDVNPCSRRGVTTLLTPLLRDGGTIWVAHPSEGRWADRVTEERATAQLRASDPGP